MSRKSSAVQSITGNFRRLRGIPPGAEAALGVDFAAILTQLLDGMLSTCLGNLSSVEAASTVKDPSPIQRRQFKAAAIRKARQAITTGKRRGKRRKEFAGDLIAAMEQQAADSTIAELTDQIDEVRA